MATKIDYEAVGGLVPNFQASTGPVVVEEIWGKPGVASRRNAPTRRG